MSKGVKSEDETCTCLDDPQQRAAWESFREYAVKPITQQLNPITAPCVEQLVHLTFHHAWVSGRGAGFQKGIDIANKALTDMGEQVMARVKDATILDAATKFLANAKNKGSA